MPPRLPVQLQLPRRRFFGFLLVALLVGSVGMCVLWVVDDVNKLNDSLAPTALSRVVAVDDLAYIIHELQQSEIEISSWVAGLSSSHELTGYHLRRGLDRYAQLSRRRVNLPDTFTADLDILLEGLDRQMSIIEEQYALVQSQQPGPARDALVRRLAAQLGTTVERCRVTHDAQVELQESTLYEAREIALSTQSTLLILGVMITLLGGTLYLLTRLSTRAVRLANERFRLAASALDGAVFDIDLRDRRIVWSEGLDEVFGYSTRGEKRDLDWWLSRMHPDELADIRRRFADALRTGGDLNVQTRFLDHRGEYRFVDIVTRVFPHEHEDGGRIVGSLVDLTERRRVEEQAATVAHRLENVVRHAPVVIFACDRELRFVFCDGEGLRALGTDADFYVGRTVAEAHPDYPILTENMERAFAGEAFSTIVDLGGRAFDCWYAPSRTEAGEIDGIIGVATDITERRTAQTALYELQDKYLQIMESTQALLFSTDLTGRLLFINEPGARTLGRTPDEMIGQSFVRFIHRDDRAMVLAAYSRQINKGLPSVELEFRALARDGRTSVTIQSSAELQYDAASGRGMISSIGLDVSKRHRAEQVQGAMYRISEAANDKSDLGDLCHEIREAMSEVVDVRNFNIALFNRRTSTIEFPYRVGDDAADPLPPPEELSRSLTAMVIRTGEPILADRARLNQIRDEGRANRLGRAATMWLGVPLSTGSRVIGVVILKAFDEKTHYTQSDVDIMMFASGQIARAIERNQSRDSLRAIVEGTSAAIGEDFFLRLVRELATALEMRYAFVGQLSDDAQLATDANGGVIPNGNGSEGTPARGNVSTLAVWAGDNYAPNMEYALAGTPCSHAVADGSCVYREAVQEYFPADEMLVDMEAVAYVGQVLRDSVGRTIGLLSVAHDAPVHETEYVQSILRVFAARAGAEMERKRAEEALTFQAFHDALTGLPNRVLFMDRLEQATARARRRASSCAVLFLDLDRFKYINDSLGHSFGDELIIEIGRRVQACVREDDTVARLGGDEFTILLSDVEESFTATKIAEDILATLQRPFQLDGHEVRVTGSIGIAFDRVGSEEADDLLRDADAAMYRAKSLGKNRYEIFDSGMHAHVREMMRLESGLRRAIEENEFRIYYQPKVLLATGRLEGMEALIRWEHPERGLLQPESFIGLAEETGLIVQIDRWIMRESCRQVKLWNEQYTRESPLIISVNMSAAQFRRDDVADHVKSVLDETGLPAQCLKLEITESMAMEDAEKTVAVLESLKSLGVRIEIDDFGTGYSSLLYLSRFPVDTVKIDRSFIMGIGEFPERRMIVNAIVQLAHNLGIGVTAEGVESADQLAYLRQLKCEHGQGFIFSKPIAVGDAETLVASDTIW